MKPFCYTGPFWGMCADCCLQIVTDLLLLSLQLWFQSRRTTLRRAHKPPPLSLPHDIMSCYALPSPMVDLTHQHDAPRGIDTSELVANEVSLRQQQQQPQRQHWQHQMEWLPCCADQEPQLGEIVNPSPCTTMGTLQCTRLETTPPRPAAQVNHQLITELLQESPLPLSAYCSSACESDCDSSTTDFSMDSSPASAHYSSAYESDLRATPDSSPASSGTSSFTASDIPDFEDNPFYQEHKSLLLDIITDMFASPVCKELLTPVSSPAASSDFSMDSTSPAYYSSAYESDLRATPDSSPSSNVDTTPTLTPLYPDSDASSISDMDDDSFDFYLDSFDIFASPSYKKEFPSPVSAPPQSARAHRELQHASAPARLGTVTEYSFQIHADPFYTEEFPSPSPLLHGSPACVHTPQGSSKVVRRLCFDGL